MTNTTFYPCGCVAVSNGSEVVTATLCRGDLYAYRSARGRKGQLGFLGAGNDYEEVVEGV